MPENPTTPPDDRDRVTGFLKRWSERKADAAAQSEPQPAAPMAEKIANAEPVEQPADGDATAAEQAPPPVTEADLENLTYDSDYTKFMGEHVPEALRRRALRQLWRSDPILANVDGLCDYDDDFTDAALAVKVLKTAHKVGQGYLTDEDLAANRAKGEPTPAAQADEVDEDFEDDSEDMSDVEDTDDLDDQAGKAEVAAADSTNDAAAADAQSEAPTDNSETKPS